MFAKRPQAASSAGVSQIGPEKSFVSCAESHAMADSDTWFANDPELTTINAALQEPVSGSELADWLRSSDAASGRAWLALNAFFSEMPLDAQLSFLARHAISEADACAVARTLLGPAHNFALARRFEW